ncbi:hypothetical protein ICM05_05440 [Leucobacter sp. cx-42]|uniref:hypothetical protein n=1 Tax=unclassified Leucobacter TaxID=2621730 RepID=UPI00165E492E|nr:MULTISPECIES: hypothetical protein [unclassified Leucobacter]MBC9954089.1 hypothetical protein [Leucobacter sp. cx-42]
MSYVSNQAASDMLSDFRIRRLFEAGLLRTSFKQLTGHLTHLDKNTRADVEEIIRMRNIVHVTARKLSTFTGFRKKAELSLIRNQIGSLFQKLAFPAPRGPFIHESSVIEWRPSKSGKDSAVATSLVAVAKELGKQVFLSSAYELLAKRLQGYGGRLNLEAFLWATLADQTFMRQLHQAWASNSVGRPMHQVQISGSVPSPAAILSYQHSSSSNVLILNNVFPADYGLLARYYIDSDKANRDALSKARTELTAFSEQQFSTGVTVLSFLPIANSSPLHASMPTPSNCFTLCSSTHENGQLTASDLFIHWDAFSNTIQLSRSDHSKIGISYWGVTPQWTHDDLTRVLLSIANPWANYHPAALRGNPLIRTTQSMGVHGSSHPRQTLGNIVLRRRSWTLNLSDFPDLGGHETNVSQLLAVEKWRVRHQLPTEAFVYLPTKSLSDLGQHKPFWVSLRSLYSIHHFCQMVRNVSDVWFEEVLPERGKGSTRYTEERLTLIQIARAETN